MTVLIKTAKTGRKSLLEVLQEGRETTLTRRDGVPTYSRAGSTGPVKRVSGGTREVSFMTVLRVPRGVFYDRSEGPGRLIQQEEQGWVYTAAGGAGLGIYCCSEGPRVYLPLF